MTPVVLQLVEDILAIGAIAIELAETEDGFAKGGDESGMLPDLAAVRDGGKRQAKLVGVLGGPGALGRAP